MKKKLFISFLVIIACFTLMGCGKTENDIKLNDAYDKVGAYFGKENLSYSNLAAYYLDTKENVVVVELIDNSELEQSLFLKLVKVYNYSEYFKFVQGGPYYASNNKNHY